MNSLIKDATKALINANSCAVKARWLHEIVGTIIAEDSNSRADLLQEVFSSVNSAATERLNTFRSLSSRDLWDVACGVEANLMYLMYEISGREKADDPRIELATLDCAASKLDRSNDRPIANTNRVGEILSYCEKEFGCISKSRYDTAVLIFPDVDIDCVAECPVLDSDVFAMIVNEKHTSFPLIETFAYEVAALLITSDDIPDEAISLLRDTISPNVDRLAEDEQFWEYLMAIKMGLAYGGPYGCMLDDVGVGNQYGPIWNEYLQQR